MSAKRRRPAAARHVNSKPQPSAKRSDGRRSSSGTLLSLTHSGLTALRARLERPAPHTPASKKSADSGSHQLLQALERLRADYERVLHSD
jgi:hypothetical protein